MDIGKYSKKWRIDRDMRQIEMAQLLGVSPAFVSAMESNKKTPTEEFLRLIGIKRTVIVNYELDCENPAANKLEGK